MEAVALTKVYRIVVPASFSCARPPLGTPHRSGSSTFLRVKAMSRAYGKQSDGPDRIGSF